MNKIHIKTEAGGTAFTFGEIMTTSHKGEKHTAFIGCWGERQNEAELYLITYDEIVLASNPSVVWSYADGAVIRFCDVRIEETS